MRRKSFYPRANKKAIGHREPQRQGRKGDGKGSACQVTSPSYLSWVQGSPDVHNTYKVIKGNEEGKADTSTGYRAGVKSQVILYLLVNQVRSLSRINQVYFRSFQSKVSV